MNARYILNGSLAKARRQNVERQTAQGFGARAHAPKEGPGRALFLSLTDTIVAEIVGDESVLIELFGAEMDFVQRLLTAIDIFQGQIGAPPDETTTRH